MNKFRIFISRRNEIIFSKNWTRYFSFYFAQNVLNQTARIVVSLLEGRLLRNRITKNVYVLLVYFRKCHEMKKVLEYRSTVGESQMFKLSVSCDGGNFHQRKYLLNELNCRYFLHFVGSYAYLFFFSLDDEFIYLGQSAAKTFSWKTSRAYVNRITEATRDISIT